jgi:hypothetical protein
MMELATRALSGDVPHGTNSSIVQVAGLQCILSGLGWTSGIVPLITEIFLCHSILLEEYQTTAQLCHVA